MSDNPPAFPMCNELGHIMQEGMTLRDYFAAAALTGMLANASGTNSITKPDVMARSANAYADAMLKVRGQS